MTSPNDNEYIGAYDTPITMSGFTLNPEEIVLVEVLDPATNQWVIISWDISHTHSVSYDGIDWYMWSVQDLAIPRQYWTGYHILSCQVRGRIYGQSQSLKTFTYWDAYLTTDHTLSEMWAEYGAGDTVRLRASRGSSSGYTTTTSSTLQIQTR